MNRNLFCLPQNKCLAKLKELQSSRYRKFINRLNELACKAQLKVYKTSSREWEYPWVWSQLEPLRGKGLKVVDIGSEKSPFPWFLAKQGFDVIISDITTQYWQIWQKASQRLRVKTEMRILDAQDLDLSTASVDLYLSVSVLEHLPDKAKAIAEAARVLRPGGLLIMTFDICETDMGMSFPEWNGQAITMREFDKLFKDLPWFQKALEDAQWNIDDIPDYFAWHRTTAPWHNYVMGAALVQRNARSWSK